MDAEFIRNRITELRLQKGISEHRMSLELGHARSYIHGIVSGKVLPSMTEFLSICDYFEITPEYFFKENTSDGILLSKLENYSKNLTTQDLEFVVELAARLSKA